MVKPHISLTGVEQVFESSRIKKNSKRYLDNQACDTKDIILIGTFLLVLFLFMQQPRCGFSRTMCEILRSIKGFVDMHCLLCLVLL